MKEVSPKMAKFFDLLPEARELMPKVMELKYSQIVDCEYIVSFFLTAHQNYIDAVKEAYNLYGDNPSGYVTYTLNLMYEDAYEDGVEAMEIIMERYFKE